MGVLSENSQICWVLGMFIASLVPQSVLANSATTERTADANTPEGRELAGERALDLVNGNNAGDLTIEGLLLQPQPFFGLLPAEAIVGPLQLNSVVPFPDFPNLTDVAESYIFEAFRTDFSPLERPQYRLYGFETGDTLRQGEWILRAGVKIFDDCEDRERSCDIHLGSDYGITDTVQFSVDVAGHEDLVYRNLFGQSSVVEMTYESISAQIKWQIHEDERWSVAPVVAIEASPERSISFSQRGSRVEASDQTVYASVALPISYQATDRVRLHFSPQASFFPETLDASVSGGFSDQMQRNIGLEGDRLDYYGTVIGLGIGADFNINTHLKVAVDYSVIVEGNNFLDGDLDGSLFGSEPVWHVGGRWTPNSRTAVDVFLTNRFGPVTASPSNLLVQPDGELIVGMELSFAPDIGNFYPIATRNHYPEPIAFLATVTGFPSATLPINSIIYEIAAGTPGRVSPLVRVGILDDLELVANFSSNGTDQFQNQGLLLFRYALLPDYGFNPLTGRKSITASLTAGIQDFFGGPALALYGEVPVTMTFAGDRLELVISPQLSLPLQSGASDSIAYDTVAGISAGLTWRVLDNTQIFAGGTAILRGNNLLGSGDSGDAFAFLDGETWLYTAGVRQLFPTDNTLYAIDFYVNNRAGEYGFQGMTALPDGEVSVGARFSILNGIPIPRTAAAPEESVETSPDSERSSDSGTSESGALSEIEELEESSAISVQNAPERNVEEAEEVVE